MNIKEAHSLENFQRPFYLKCFNFCYSFESKDLRDVALPLCPWGLPRKIEEKYLSAVNDGESLPEATPLKEIMIQALWFERLYRSSIQLIDGEEVKIIQSGFWNHGAGPDFTQVVIETREGRQMVGDAEIHYELEDWERHGHHRDPKYNKVLLHVVWKRPKENKVCLRNDYRSVPLVVLSENLVAPEDEVVKSLPLWSRGRLPAAKPGLCAMAIRNMSEERQIALLTEAGQVRLRNKAQRLRWRRRLFGEKQALWESMGEVLGYSKNRETMRLLTQRIRIEEIIRLQGVEEYKGVLMGAAGWLPSTSYLGMDDESKREAEKMWEVWWRERDRLSFAQIDRKWWIVGSQRPLNRPIRRIAALSAIAQEIPTLLASLNEADACGFRQRVSSVRDSFWEHRYSWLGKKAVVSERLIGPERLRDMEINLILPWIGMDDIAKAESMLAKKTQVWNAISTVASQRVLGEVPRSKAYLSAIVQQGLQQIHQDYCVQDLSNCSGCQYPARFQR